METSAPVTRREIDAMGREALLDLPRRALVPPEALPIRFVSLAGAAFRQAAGLK